MFFLFEQTIPEHLVRVLFALIKSWKKGILQSFDPLVHVRISHRPAKMPSEYKKGRTKCTAAFYNYDVIWKVNPHRSMREKISSENFQNIQFLVLQSSKRTKLWQKLTRWKRFYISAKKIQSTLSIGYEMIIYKQIPNLLKYAILPKQYPFSIVNPNNSMEQTHIKETNNLNTLLLDSVSKYARK